MKTIKREVDRKEKKMSYRKKKYSRNIFIKINFIKDYIVNQLYLLYKRDFFVLNIFSLSSYLNLRRKYLLISSA